MDIYDLIANSSEEYCDLVSKLINDKEFNDSIISKIKENKHKLFYDKQTITEYEDFFDKLKN